MLYLESKGLYFSGASLASYSCSNQLEKFFKEILVLKKSYYVVMWCRSLLFLWNTRGYWLYCNEFETFVRLKENYIFNRIDGVKSKLLNKGKLAEEPRIFLWSIIYVNTAVILVIEGEKKIATSTCFTFKFPKLTLDLDWKEEYLLCFKINARFPFLEEWRQYVAINQKHSPIVKRLTRA